MGEGFEADLGVEGDELEAEDWPVLVFGAFDAVTDEGVAFPVDAAGAGDFAGVAVGTDLDGAGLVAGEDEDCDLGGIGINGACKSVGRVF